MSAAPAVTGVTLTPGAGRFEFRRSTMTIPVWYFLPEKLSPQSPVLFVMHGVGRDANRYRDEWKEHAEKHHFILVVPEFSEAAFPGSDGYSLGEGKGAKPGAASSYSFLEPIFDAVKTATGNRSERYHLFGHSAGAQFVHRYLYFMPEARVATAVAANAGWWTMPDRGVDFPYGLRGAGAGDSRSPGGGLFPALRGVRLCRRCRHRAPRAVSLNAPQSSSTGTPGSCLAVRIASADFTWLTLGAVVSWRVRKVS